MKKKTCFKCGQVGHVVSKCSQPAMGNCFRCHSPGHWARECPSGKCSVCGKTGHALRSCPERETFRCQRCQGFGHASVECPSRPGSDLICTRCGQIGHSTRRCTNVANTNEESQTSEDTEPKIRPPKKRAEPFSNGWRRFNPASGARPKSPIASPPFAQNSPKPPRAESPSIPSPQQRQVRPVPIPAAAIMASKALNELREYSYLAAISSFTKAIERDDRIWEYYSGRALAYNGQRDYPHAVVDFQKAMSDPFYCADPNTHLELSLCWLHLGSLSKALDAVREHRFTPGSDKTTMWEFKERLERLERNIERYEESSQKHQWRAARTACDGAIQIYEEEECEVPLEMRVWEVEVLVGEGQLIAAEEAVSYWLDDSAEGTLKAPDLLYFTALILFLHGEITQSITQLVELLVKHDPDHSKAKSLRVCAKQVKECTENGMKAYILKQWDEAVLQYGLGLTAMTPYASHGGGGAIRIMLLRMRATALHKLDRFDEAMKDANAALEVDPEHFRTLKLRAQIHVSLQLFDAAVADFEVALALAPEDETAALRAELSEAEEMRSAPKDYREILGLQPGCSLSDVKKAYRRFSLKHHPDKGGLPEMFKRGTEAYRTLSDVLGG